MLKDSPSLTKLMVALVTSVSSDPHSPGHGSSRIKRVSPPEHVNDDKGCLPVQEFPVLSSPAVPKLFCVHASNLVQVRLVYAQETKPIHLPVP